MKYGESAFDVLYLLFAVSSGILMLCKAKKKDGKLMGVSALVLGLGDAFHLVPRVLNYFVDADFTKALGIGKLITSVTMTVFYVLLYFVWLLHFKKGRDQSTLSTIFILAISRIVLCLFPQNGWLTNESDVTWGIIRNVPFVILGALVCLCYYQTRSKDHDLRLVFLYILLSFLFYLPVAVGAPLLPALGMLMLPKTVCYVLMIISFLHASLGNRGTKSGT